ncbi:mucin-5B-like [Patiria miniata]|uniref:WxxW domain-containing protein n=1 Tax=Patiria miniata TaxID=46514 RepID=A0A914BQT8_PATMI|nr:mucin-5B-like [Patiria miniata]
MKTALFVVCCILAVESIQGHTWSAWYDRDNPSGTGDWETLSSQKKLGYVCGGCKPIAAECRVKGSASVFTRWTGSAPDTLAVRCLPTAGVVCKNTDQPGGALCSDYEIRYLCPSTASTWTQFKDRDNPSGTGDWENVSAFRNRDGDNICNGIRPMCTQCRDTSNLNAYYTTGDAFNTGYDCNWENGLVCTTEVNTEVCKDYDVRFKCPNIGTCTSCARWTSWKNRDYPSATGDWEHVGASGHNPCSSKEPIDIQCRVRGTNQNWSDAGQELKTKCTPSEGLVCLNADQTSGQSCLNYEVRFLCP